MKRRLAREIAVSSLYQMEMNEVTAAEAVDMLMEEARSENEIGAEFVDNENTDSYVRELVNGVAERKAAIDDMLQQFLTGWQVDRLSRVDRQILRVAYFEMVYGDEEDVPPKAAINEAIELAKHFGTEESGKFVNGVLGKLMQSLEQLKSQSSE
ncbi:transcription antitermination factor NusB [Paenibacillus sp. NPDC058071]|uniref:transcription antitermination factor NusB n=1 Tax=Paenibacillus sp. NPDC058071 TaxID=3346326 RepID=UPI0036DB1290